MKKIIVVLFLICLAYGEWQKGGEVALPKSIQVNDLTINNSGEVWILSGSSILKLEGPTKNPVLIQEIPDGKLLAVQDRVFILDNLNRLITLDPVKTDLALPTKLLFDAASQISTIAVDNNQLIAVLGANQLSFASHKEVFGTLITNADRFGVIPLADYNNTQTPLFTLTNNRIYSWTGGAYNNTEKYQSNLLYSATNNILDFSTDQRGNLYVLFSDSIVVLGTNGEYIRKISIDNMSLGSRILTNPTNNDLILFDPLDKTLSFLSNVRDDDRGDIIVLNKNVPNPVDNYTQIEFTINQSLSLTITIYNLIGEPVKVITKGHYSKGTYRVTWNADDESGDLVPNGVYFYRLESARGVAIRQLIVLR
jgi:hypothetical protein